MPGPTSCQIALFGGSVLAAAIAVALAGMSGMRQLRKLLSGENFRVVRLDGSQLEKPGPRRLGLWVGLPEGRYRLA